jgi:hypothetical protein
MAADAVVLLIERVVGDSTSLPLCALRPACGCKALSAAAPLR